MNTTRQQVVIQLVEGLMRMEAGRINPFPIPPAAFDTYLEIYGTINYDNYRLFVCAVILGYFDDEIEDWK